MHSTQVQDPVSQAGRAASVVQSVCEWSICFIVWESGMRVAFTRRQGGGIPLGRLFPQ